jgi:hypothetical protein
MKKVIAWMVIAIVVMILTLLACLFIDVGTVLSVAAFALVLLAMAALSYLVSKALIWAVEVITGRV